MLYSCFIHALSMLYPGLPCFIHAISMLYPCSLDSLSYYRGEVAWGKEEIFYKKQNDPKRLLHVEKSR